MVLLRQIVVRFGKYDRNRGTDFNPALLALRDVISRVVVFALSCIGMWNYIDEDRGKGEGELAMTTPGLTQLFDLTGKWLFLTLSESACLEVDQGR